MPKKSERAVKRWSDHDLEQALLEIQTGKSIRSTASKYGMAEGTLRYRSKQLERGEAATMGRPTAFSEETEKELASCIGVMCKLGFSPTVPEILDLVASYLKANSISTSSFPSGKPGKDWFYGFVKRRNLSLKKATMISSARKSATANPFVIYDFYEQLEEIVTSKHLSAKQIWNCDESGFPSDPANCKVVSEKGKVAYKVTCGSGRENTTTLAVCSAAGECLDPFIVFSGKNLQSTWRGERALPGTLYGTSPNGWMTTELFDGWFTNFCKQVTIRPLLLIFDGHLTHVSLEVIEKARTEDVTLLKLPPHVTDKLQPLDVACFGPLKRMWEKVLNEWINEFGPREPIRKAQFVNKLGDVWHKGLSPENIMAGFNATGVFPVDKSKFPESRFDTRLIKRYQNWVKAGRPKELLNDLATGVHSPKKASPKKSPEKKPSKSPVKRPATPKSNLQPSTSTPTTSKEVVEECNCSLAKLLGPTPCPAPPGKVWVPIWTLQNEAAQESKNKSFEELVVEKMKGPSDKPRKKRRKIDLMTKVITDDEYLKAIKEKEGKQAKKGSDRGRGRPKKARTTEAPPKLDFDVQEGSDSERETSDDTDDSDSENVEKTTFPPVSKRQSVLYLRDFWRSVNPPVPEEQVVGKWYAAIYLGKRKEQIYVGRATKRFLSEKDGPATCLELDCLKPHFGSGSILESVPAHLERDVDIFAIQDIFAGPLTVNPLKGDKWDVPQYEKVKKTFELVVKLDRESDYLENFAS